MLFQTVSMIYNLRVFPTANIISFCVHFPFLLSLWQHCRTIQTLQNTLLVHGPQVPIGHHPLRHHLLRLGFLQAVTLCTVEMVLQMPAGHQRHHGMHLPENNRSQLLAI